LRAVIEQLDDLEGTVAGLKKRVKKLEGTISGGERADPEPATHEVAPERTIEDHPDISPPPRPSASTEHLARRFRIGG
jgi:hypothetical protein